MPCELVEGAEVEFHSLIAAVDGGEWSASQTVALFPEPLNNWQDSFQVKFGCSREEESFLLVPGIELINRCSKLGRSKKFSTTRNIFLALRLLI